MARRYAPLGNKNRGRHRSLAGRLKKLNQRMRRRAKHAYIPKNNVGDNKTFSGTLVTKGKRSLRSETCKWNNASLQSRDGDPSTGLSIRNSEAAYGHRW